MPHPGKIDIIIFCVADTYVGGQVGKSLVVIPDAIVDRCLGPSLKSSLCSVDDLHNSLTFNLQVMGSLT